MLTFATTHLCPTCELHSSTCKDATGSPLRYTDLKVVELKVSWDGNICEVVHKECNYKSCHNDIECHMTLNIIFSVRPCMLHIEEVFCQCFLPTTITTLYLVSPILFVLLNTNYYCPCSVTNPKCKLTISCHSL